MAGQRPAPSVQKWERGLWAPEPDATLLGFFPSTPFSEHTTPMQAGPADSPALQIRLCEACGVRVLLPEIECHLELGWGPQAPGSTLPSLREKRPGVGRKRRQKAPEDKEEPGLRKGGMVMGPLENRPELEPGWYTVLC